MTLRQFSSSAITLTLLGLASPGFAQGNLCGGAGTGGVWIGGDAASSDISNADSYLEQMALVLGGNEYVALFSVGTGTEVRVEAAGRGAGDPVIDLLDESGGIVLSDDDSGGNGAARAETFLNPGTYCMNLRSYEGGPMTAFVRVSRTDQEPLTEGIGEIENVDASTGCAAAVPLGGIDTSATASIADTPFWSFSLDAPTPVSITATNEAADPVMTLYDSNNSSLAENDDTDGLNPRLDMTEPLAAGTYCIGLQALDDATAPVTVTVTTFDPAAALQRLYDSGEASPPLDGSHPVTALGLLDTRVRQDVQASGTVSWFTIDVDDNSLLLIEAIGVGDGDPWLTVYDDLGRQIAQNDDYGDKRDSLVVVKADPGTYVVGVKHYDEATGLIRLVAERYVRAK
ncbi:PPC domain-containing protein [Yoonia sediminilitoris]|uniref:Pre-peptidase n=1 Tax=Yoonia sediminilitoris TaxID=1286148 RepID=A0A2T6K8H5_9RHOB|nr:PPC domain-containing protein [Yoonia sediminilitoris]PUB11038.1 pre-peptidase [Yoonia sediminilitoris]RCW90957.1 pre-peptidase [Yoonia sediminilitoris]